MKYGISPVNNLSTGYLQSALSTALQDAGLNTAQAGASTAVRQDESRISSFTQLLKALQQLHQSDPAKYKQVTAQIATDLEKAADTAQKQGNTTAATQLTQLSKDFSEASKTGAPPNSQDLAQAMRGHHRHHHSDTSSSGGSGSTGNQLLSSLYANGSEAGVVDPVSIIGQALSNAEVTAS